MRFYLKNIKYAGPNHKTEKELMQLKNNGLFSNVGLQIVFERYQDLIFLGGASVLVHAISHFVTTMKIHNQMQSPVGSLVGHELKKGRLLTITQSQIKKRLQRSLVEYRSRAHRFLPDFPVQKTLFRIRTKRKSKNNAL